ncbi:hypothetical protein [Herpetosiphon sp. NSE202]|uniref:hypothetical protein n=1 Tax=Herpetosiphon sp. NSE202 TaxID=3351349 RepID=UPI00363AFE22
MIALDWSIKGLGVLKLRQITSVLGILWQPLLCWAMVLHLGVGCPVGCVVNGVAQEQFGQHIPRSDQSSALDCPSQRELLPSQSLEPSTPSNMVVQLVAWFPMVLIVPRLKQSLASQRRQWRIPRQKACSYIMLPITPPPRSSI